MKTKITNGLSATVIGISLLSIFSVCVMAFTSPQAVMDLVQVQLPNTDAYSSIRGVYGGVSVAIIAITIYLWRQQQQRALWFLALLWGMYAISRSLTIVIDGALGPFGTQWLLIESILSLSALSLAITTRKLKHS